MPELISDNFGQSSLEMPASLPVEQFGGMPWPFPGLVVFPL